MVTILQLYDWGYHLVPWSRSPRKPLVLGWQQQGTNPTGFLRAYDDTIDWAVVPTTACVLDLEMKNGLNGVSDLAAMGFDISKLECPRTRTKSGGFHLWFRQPAEPLTGGHHIRPGVEAKAINGSVHIPPSVGYTCEVPLVKPEDLPPLPALLVAQWKSTASKRANIGTQAYRTEVYANSERRYRMCSMAGRLRAVGLTEPELIQALLAVRDTRCADPSSFTDAEVIGIAKDYARRPTETLQPRSESDWIQVVGANTSSGSRPSSQG